jgi:prolyl-tRNA editing enzyme YbaK/EbsC (Cys-tRNA(Pro) deacylase)
MSLDHPAVKRVQAALAAQGSAASVIALAETARSAEDAARSIGTERGSIVKSLVFMVEGEAVMALIAGDRRCDPAALPAALGLAGRARRADADQVRAATGFAIGGVAPVGHATRLKVAIDASLGRFETVYAAAGHPHCVFPTTLDELRRLTGGVIADGIGVSTLLDTIGSGPLVTK